MLSTVEVRTTAGTLLTLPLETVSNGIYIEDIGGLDPVKATIVSSSFANMDGSQYQSARRESRNITIKVALDPDYSIESVADLRARIYNFFMPKSNVSLRFIMDNDLEVDISGRVESCETPLFTKDPQVDISIICFDPDFVDITPVEFSGESTDDTDEELISYVGSVETGMTFVLNIDRTLTEFTIYHRAPDGSVRTLDVAGAFEADDVLTIVTVKGQKELTLTRDAVSSSALYAMSPQSNWIEFEKGNNYIRVYAIGDPIPYDLSYTTRYGGL